MDMDMDMDMDRHTEAGAGNQPSSQPFSRVVYVFLSSAVYFLSHSLSLSLSHTLFTFVAAVSYR